MKKVSIIVTVYNVEKYLEKCLNSLINQTLRDLEIIIINDESPDNSQKIIDKFTEKYPQIIKSYTIKNRGLGGARNYALNKCTGKYIMYVDSDDYIAKDMAKELYEIMIKEKSDIAICGYNIIKEENNKIIGSEQAFSPIEPTNPIFSLLFGRTAVWNKMYKKELLINNNIEFREKKWYEDVDFSLKAILKAHKVSFINKPFYNYLIREGSIMNNNNLTRQVELCDSFNEVINYCKQEKIYEKNKDNIEFCCIYHMYICGITRVINTNANKQLKKETIELYRKYIDNNFSNYKKNKYIKYLDKNKKLIYNLINLRCYFMIRLLFKIKGV